jgi:hypothetical protein
MAEIPVHIVQKKTENLDPFPIPNWFDDPEQVAPCPCGQPPDESCMLVTGDTPLSRWFHQGCLDFLEKEMDEEEIEEKHEWERQMKKLQERNEEE